MNVNAGYGGGHGGGYAGGYRDAGDVHTQHSINPTAMDALESAVALPGVFTPAEMHRTLRRNHFDVMKTALQLREKHAQRTQQHYDALNIGLNTLQIELKKGYVHLLENACDMNNCPILLLQLRYFKPSFSTEKMQLKGMGAMDGSSSLEDTRRLCVYMMDLAVEVMEENKADGVVFIVDLDNCALNNLEAKMVTDILQVMKYWYPECIRYVLVINGTTFTRGITHLLTKLASERTQQRIKILQNSGELRHFIHPQSVPQLYGGMYRLMPPIEWMKIQADIEEVDLESQAPAREEQKYMTKDARLLNGMQYAACSVDQVVEMKTSVIRGPMYRNKSGVAWVKMYAILRPEALLLYENVTSKMPQIIIPVNHEVSVKAATFADAPRGTFGFRMDVPGVAGGHLLAACSDHERGNWLQEIQMNITADEEDVARQLYKEEKRMREEREFAALNMISFDDPAPSPQTQPPAQQQPPASSSSFQAPPQQQGMYPPAAPFGQMPAQPQMANTMNNAGAMGGFMGGAMSQQQPQQFSMMSSMGMPANGMNPGMMLMGGTSQQHYARPPQPMNMPMGQQPTSMMNMQPGMMGMMNTGGYPMQQNPGQFPQQQQFQMNQQLYNPQNMQNFRG
uniref:CRAL-TRIO domain-containing protein n=1 Tax=Globisporangium ultimum (strain ATCC 200006 / CBS 805.95 / DAOM BR144) TaxID=431595 RepID=K3XB45_GLOUD